jgi:hypothetical protein
MSTSKALAITGKPNVKGEQVKAEKVGGASDTITVPAETLHIHSALLLAAESMVSKKPAIPVLGGILLHRREKIGRIVGMDGPRMFLASYALPHPMPSWLKDGVVLDAENLRKRVQLITAMSDDPMITLSHTKGHGFVEMSDQERDAVFRIPVIRQPFLDYESKIQGSSFVSLDEDGNVTGREWEPVGINSAYLKHVGDVAKTLEAGLDKKNRSKGGMIVRAYNSTPTAPLVFDFSTWPGAVLIMLPARLADNKTSQATAALMAPATKLTLAALTAHETRNRAWAEAADDDAKKAGFIGKADEFARRIAKIREAVHAQAMLAETKAPAPAPEPEPEPVVTPDPQVEADNWAQGETTVQPAADPVEPEPEVKPEIRRTPIKTKRAAKTA